MKNFTPFFTTARRGLSVVKTIIIVMVLFFATTESIVAQSNRTVTFTGAITDFNTAERLAASANNTTYAITFDASNIYIAAFKTSGTFASSDNLAIYLDTDPNATPTSGTGTTTGQSYNSVTGVLPFSANYNVHAEQSSQEARSFGSNWTSTISGVTYNTGTTWREVKIPFSSIGTPDALYLTMWMGSAGGFYSNAPGTNITTAANPTITSYFGGIGVSSADCIPVNITNTAITGTVTNAAPSSGAVVGKLVISSGTTIATTNNFTIAPGGSIQLSGSAVLNITGRTITMGGATVGDGRGTTINIAGTASITTTSGNIFVFNGEGNWTGNAYSYLGNLRLNRGFTPMVSGGLTIGAAGIVDLRTAGTIRTNGFTYMAGSTLKYNTGTTYTAATEWSANAASGTGVPSNVTIGDVVASSVCSFGTASTFRQANGAVTISAATSGLTLSTVIGGDLRLTGNFVQSGTFTHSGRSVTFNGTTSTTQTITATSSSLESTGTTNCFASLINNTSGTGGLTIGANNITVAGSSGNVLQLVNTGRLNLGGRRLRLSNSGGNILVDGTTGLTAKSINSTSGGTIAIAGSKTVSAIASGTLVTNSNVTWVLTAGMNFSEVTTVNGTLRIDAGGFVASNNPPIYGVGSTLNINSGGTYSLYDSTSANESAGWFRNVASTGASQQGIPWNFSITNDTAVNWNSTGGDEFSRSINGVFTVAATVITGSSFAMSTIASGNLFVRGNFTNNGTFTANGREVTLNGINQTISGLSTTFEDLVFATNEGRKIFGVSTTISGNLTIDTGVVANLSTFGSTAATLTTGTTARDTGTSYGGGTNSPAANIDATFFNATATGYLNVGTCIEYSITSTENTSLCIATAATISVASTTTTNLPTGTYSVQYTLTGGNTGTFTATMTVDDAGLGSFLTESLTTSGATVITINYLTNGCVSKLTSNNTAIITVQADSTVSSGDSTQTCMNIALTAITHTTTGATGISNDGVDGANGLPSGVSATWSGDVLTISGTPTSEGEFSYSIPLIGCDTVNATGAITVKAASTAAVISGSLSICSGSSTNLQVAITGGTSPYTVEYSEGTVGSYNSGSTILVSPSSTTAYTLISVTDANGCVGTNNSGSAVVTIDLTTSTDGGISWNNGDPSSGKSIVFDGSTGTIGTNFAACSIRLTNNATVSVNAGFDITLEGKLTVDSGSAFTLNNNANLIQNTTIANSGNIVVKRNSSALKRLDYTLWSSPVAGQGLYAFSKFTLPNRFYVYDTATDLYSNSVGFSLTGLQYPSPLVSPNGIDGSDSADITFTTGLGYLIRVPYNHPTTPTVYNGVFTGVPNNGDVAVPMTIGYTAVGNPYPSRINVNAFIDGNPNITGSLYLWRKTNDNTATSYATLTKTAYVANGAAGGDTGAGFFNFGDETNWAINIGQGFIVNAVSGSTINFTNDMRISSNHNQFFRDSQTVNTANNGLYWLNLTNSAGIYSQMAVGYSSEGTLAEDKGIDGKNINNEFYLTSLIGADEYSIQGRSDFDSSDIVPLSYKAKTVGNHTISIDHKAGGFTTATQNIYLKDNLTTTLHDLNSGAYTFATAAGTFNSRFEIVYQTQLSNPSFTANTVVIYSQNNEFVINAGNVIMASIKVFDIRGRLIEEKKAINSTQTTIKGGLANQVLLVQITSEDGDVVTKKVVR